MKRLLSLMFGIAPIDRRWMAYLITFPVAHACTIKGERYVHAYPGVLGWALFFLSPLTAVVVGINLMAVVKRGNDAR